LPARCYHSARETWRHQIHLRSRCSALRAVCGIGTTTMSARVPARSSSETDRCIVHPKKCVRDMPRRASRVTERLHRVLLYLMTPSEALEIYGVVIRADLRGDRR